MLFKIFIFHKKLFPVLFLLFSALQTVFASQFSDNQENSFPWQEVISALIIDILIVVLLVILHRNKIKKRISIMQDELTGVLTVTGFKKEVERKLSKQKKDYFMISLDINNFRYIVEFSSQETANKLIKEFAAHIKQNVPKNTLICHNYMDNFFIFAEQLQEFKEIRRIELENLIYSIKTADDSIKEYLPPNYTLEFSTGVYEINADDYKNESADEMMEKANTAREIGKKGINPKRVSFFTKKMKETRDWEREINFDMERALEEKEFEVYFQPKYCLATGKIASAEALVRWNHKKHGLLLPNNFIPIFEKNGFIKNLDTFVFTECCRLLKELRENGDDNLKNLKISCNLSRLNLYDENLAGKYSDIADKFSIPPELIEIELTESLMIDNKKNLLSAMSRIKAAGFPISVDDFGSGFSSLNLLKDIPASAIKLDKGFLNKDDKNKREKVILNSIINMIKDLNIKTVVEGVETKEQLDFLKTTSCDIVQGFFYAKPMPESQFKTLLAESF